MKRILTKWVMAALAMACLTIVSCKEDDTPKVDPNFPAAVTSALEAGGSYTLNLEPNTDWSVELKYDNASAGWFWIQDGNSQVYTVRGKAGEPAVITVCAGEQTDFDTQHSCTLEMTMGGQTQTIATFTRGTVERFFTLAYCKVEDGNEDYVYAADEATELQYEYNEALSADDNNVPLVWLGRTQDFRRSVLISANFDWQLKTKPEELLTLKVTEGADGASVEVEFEADPTKYPLEDKTVEIVFCAKDNAEAEYKYNVAIPGCADMFSISGFQKVSNANELGEFYKENILGEGSWMPQELGISGDVLGLENTKIFTFVYVVENQWNAFWDNGKESTEWISAEIEPWDAEAGVLQSRKLTIKVTENDDEDRQAYVLAVPADQCPENDYSFFPDGQQLDAKYEKYVVTHVMQTAAEAKMSIYPQDAEWMAEEGTKFEVLPEQFMPMAQQLGATDAYMLTYTNKAALSDASANLIASFEVTEIMCFDLEGEMLFDPSSDWLSVSRFGQNGFHVDMNPELDQFKGVPAEAFMIDVDNLGFIMLFDTDGIRHLIFSCYKEVGQQGGDGDASIDFAYPDYVQGATLTKVDMNNLYPLNDKYEKFDSNLDFTEDFFMAPLYVLSYTSEQPTMAMLNIPPVNSEAQISVNPYSGAEWLEFELNEEMGKQQLSIFMEKPESGQAQYAIIRILDQGWSTKAIIYCFPEF